MILLTVLYLAALVSAETVTDDFCSEAGESEFFPVPGSCSQVYHCYKGKLTVRQCVDDLWWNAEKGYCTYQTDSGCTEEQTTETTTTSTTCNVTTEEVTSENPVEVTTPGRNTTICTSEDVILIPHEDSCDKYYVCPGLNEVPIMWACKPNFHFDIESEQCVPADVAKCNTNGTKCPTGLEQDQVVYLPNPNNCSSYFLCVNNSQVELMCKEGLYWNEAVESCDYADQVTCSVRK